VHPSLAAHPTRRVSRLRVPSPAACADTTDHFYWLFVTRPSHRSATPSRGPPSVFKYFFACPSDRSRYTYRHLLLFVSPCSSYYRPPTRYTRSAICRVRRCIHVPGRPPREPVGSYALVFSASRSSPKLFARTAINGFIPPSTTSPFSTGVPVSPARSTLAERRSGTTATSPCCYQPSSSYQVIHTLFILLSTLFTATVELLLFFRIRFIPILLMCWSVCDRSLCLLTLVKVPFYCRTLQQIVLYTLYHKTLFNCCLLVTSYSSSYYLSMLFQPAFYASSFKYSPLSPSYGRRSRTHTHSSPAYVCSRRTHR